MRTKGKKRKSVEFYFGAKLFHAISFRLFFMLLIIFPLESWQGGGEQGDEREVMHVNKSSCDVSL